MVDVRLLYPSEKLEAAARLAEAIEAAGYSVERESLPDSRGFPHLAAEAGKARALLLIWSRGLVSAAMDPERLAQIRRHPNLVEISADGIEPVSGGEGSPVVLLCGWRGQPFHPGWQRILADIKRLCGSRDASRNGRRDIPSGPGPGPKATARSRPGLPPVRAAVAAGALIAATLGAAAAFQSDPSRPPAQTRQVTAGPEGAGSRTKAAAASPAPVEAVGRVAMVDNVLTSAKPASAMPAESVSAHAPSSDRIGPRKAVTAKRSNQKRLAAASGGEVKRYSRKHSKTMRLFCQRSGRSTPQCRTFARSTRHLRG